MTVSGEHYIADALATLDGLLRDLRGKLDAHSLITMEDVEAVERAREAVRTARSLWEDQEGLLDIGHDHVREWDRPAA